jgi:hypothetical protein
MFSSKIGITILQLQNYLLVPNLIFNFFFYACGMGRGCYGNKLYLLISIGHNLSTHKAHLMIEKAFVNRALHP